jgi:hypothetical protein
MSAERERFHFDCAAYQSRTDYEPGKAGSTYGFEASDGMQWLVIRDRGEIEGRACTRVRRIPALRIAYHYSVEFDDAQPPAKAAKAKPEK